MQEWAKVVLSREDSWQKDSFRGRVARDEENGTIIHTHENDDVDSIKIREVESAEVLKKDKVIEEREVHSVVSYPTKNTVHVHGHSDDIIKVTGAVEEEFYPDELPQRLKIFEPSRGMVPSVLEVDYNRNAEWEISIVSAGSAVYFNVSPAGSELSSKFTAYSDTVQLSYESEVRVQKI